MPIGCYSLVPDVAYRLATRRPRSVLDLGIGFGHYGSVVRQWLDNGILPWDTYLVGVEGWEGYRNPAWQLYNAVVVDSIEGFLGQQTGCFDCVLLMDVIEHFEKAVGIELVERIQQVVAPGGFFLIGTPAIFMEQDAVYGNEFERHRALWTAADFQQCGFQLINDGQPDRFGNQMLLAEWVAM